MNNVIKLLLPAQCWYNKLRILNKRSLFNKVTLGLDDYEAMRSRYNNKTLTYNTFREKMREYTAEENKQMIFTDDLKQFLHICTKSDEDLSLLEKMMIRFHKQNSALRFGNYNFGPVIMRLYHYLNEPNLALKLFYNSELTGLFDQVSSYVILMDLLFKNEKYQEIIDVYKTYCDKQFSFSRYPKSAMVILYATCYKINSEELFKFAMDLWREMNESGINPMRRVTIFAAAFAIKQNDPHIAMEILTVIPNQNYVLVRCLKALALTAIGRVEDALLILSSVLTFDTPNVPKQTFPEDVIAVVKEAVEKSDSKELKFEFERLSKQLTQQGHICNESLDSLILAPIAIIKSVNKSQSMLHSAFNGPKIQKIFRRPGLHDII